MDLDPSSMISNIWVGSCGLGSERRLAEVVGAASVGVMGPGSSRRGGSCRPVRDGCLVLRASSSMVEDGRTAGLVLNSIRWKGSCGCGRLEGSFAASFVVPV